MPLAIWQPDPRLQLLPTPTSSPSPSPSPSSSASKIQQACSAWATWAHSLVQILCVTRQVLSRQQHARHSSLEYATAAVGLWEGSLSLSFYLPVACEQRRVNCQLTTPPKATQSTGKQTRKPGVTHTHTHTHTHSTPTSTLNNSPHRPDISFALLLNIFFCCCCPFFMAVESGGRRRWKVYIKWKTFSITSTEIKCCQLATRGTHRQRQRQRQHGWPAERGSKKLMAWRGARGQREGTGYESQ